MTEFSMAQFWKCTKDIPDLDASFRGLEVAITAGQGDTQNCVQDGIPRGFCPYNSRFEVSTFSTNRLQPVDTLVLPTVQGRFRPSVPLITGQHDLPQRSLFLFRIPRFPHVRHPASMALGR